MKDAPQQFIASIAGRYRLERELGAGGMAVVYLAEDLKHRRQVAVKVLRPELSAVCCEPDRFLREIEIAARLAHPHILPLFDSGQAGQLLYYVMPYVAGESLRDRLRREKQLPLGEALRITSEVADALAFAHAEGVVHRDIKPENILFQAGHAVVSDFGIARAVSASGGDTLTASGLAVGTPAYMSPEQAAGEHDVDARSDIYTLGCVLYEMLVGEPPFTGPTAQVVMAKRFSDPVPSARRLRSGVTEAVDVALRRALSPVPADRFETAAEFAAALTAAPVTPVPEAARSTAEGRSIVVLPFENLSPDPDNAFFADGLTEELIADLSKVRALRVISRTSAMHYKGTSKTLPTVAAELNVRSVLEGSVRRAGNTLRITAQLIDAGTDTHVWAETFSGTLDDVFELQERLARRIVNALEIALAPEEDRRMAHRPMSDIGAHDIWLRARQSALTLTSEGLDRARELVEQALAIADDNALLHATLAWVHALRYSGLVEGADETLQLCGRHAERAIALDPSLSWSLFATSIFHLRRGDLPSFVRFATQALDVERDSHTLAVLGLQLASAGRFEAARRYAAEAAARDPLTWITSFAEAHVEIQSGDGDAGFERLRDSVRRLAHGDPFPTFELAYAALQAGREPEALAWFRTVGERAVPLYAGLSRLFASAILNDRTAAAGLLKTPEMAVAAPRDARACCMVASCLARVGEADHALAWLERGIERWYTNHQFLSDFDRWFAPLHGDRRFHALLERARAKQREIIV